MSTNVRNSLRKLAKFRKNAGKGAARKSFFGAAKGKIAFHGDLTGPTLTNDDWKPSL